MLTTKIVIATVAIGVSLWQKNPTWLLLLLLTLIF
jgi:hypothetical protein